MNRAARLPTDAPTHRLRNTPPNVTCWSSLSRTSPRPVETEQQCLIGGAPASIWNQCRPSWLPKFAKVAREIPGIARCLRRDAREVVAGQLSKPLTKAMPDRDFIFARVRDGRRPSSAGSINHVERCRLENFTARCKRGAVPSTPVRTVARTGDEAGAKSLRGFWMILVAGPGLEPGTYGL